MNQPPADDAVLTLDEVFQDEEILRLVLSAEEWEVIIALAEVGGASSVDDLRKLTRMESGVIQEVIKSLLARGIVGRGDKEEPSAAAKSAPDAEVAQYLEFLRDMNYYQVLQLNPEADPGDVRHGYFRLMREYHPDRFMKEKNPETREQLKEIFRVLTRAYETLSDPRRRREYDLTIPGFTGALEREDDLALEAIWSGEAGPGPLPERNPELARSFFENALDDYERQNYEAAELNFKLAVALDPEVDDYRAGLAKTRRLVARRQAKEDAVKALFFEEEGKPSLAIRWLKRAVDLDPEVPEYRFDLARLIEAHGADLHLARMQILLALDRHPGRVDYLILFAKIQERLSELTDAVRTYRRVISLDPANPIAKAALEKLKERPSSPALARPGKGKDF